MDAGHELLTTMIGFAKQPGYPQPRREQRFHVRRGDRRAPSSDRVDAASLDRILDGCVTFGLLAAKRDGSNGALKRYYGLNALS
jgi:hypothetical protein